MKKIIEHLKENWIRHGFETLVVTVGILGAFTLNHWNEERKDRSMEKDFLRDINMEFKENRLQFLRIHGLHNRVYKECQAIHSMFPVTGDNWDSIRSIITIFFSSPVTFDPTQGSIESLKNSASFDLIKDQLLKSYLISWNDQVADYKEEEEMALQLLTDHIWPFLINRSNAEKLFNSDSYVLPESSWQEFENLVYLRLRTISYFADSSSGRFFETEELVNSMDSIILLTEPYVE